MDGDGFLSASRVAIIGLGLMGGSLAMALKGKCGALLGIDSDPETVTLAREWGIVDQADTRLDNLLPQADLIILATPVRTILSLLAQLPQLHPGAAMIMDLGSTKQQVMAAMDNLPDRFDPLGGHPMCGKEKASLRFAESSLYQEAPFALCALSRTSSRARLMGEALARAVAACPLWVEPAEHDRWVASTSHAPYLVACALAQATSLDSTPMLGPGFRSTARLAGSSTRMMLDILVTNPDNIRIAIKGIREQLAQYETLLELGDFETMAALLEQSAAQYHQLVKK